MCPYKIHVRTFNVISNIKCRERCGCSPWEELSKIDLLNNFQTTDTETEGPRMLKDIKRTVLYLIVTVVNKSALK
jgi:hypothetical protein